MFTDPSTLQVKSTNLEEAYVAAFTKRIKVEKKREERQVDFGVYKAHCLASLHLARILLLKWSVLLITYVYVCMSVHVLE